MGDFGPAAVSASAAGDATAASAFGIANPPPLENPEALLPINLIAGNKNAKTG